MDCPKCKIVNPDGSLTCDCGYNFRTGCVEKSFGTSRSEPAAYRVVASGLLIVGCAVIGSAIWIFSGTSFACRFGWGGNLCGLVAFETAPIGCLLGILWASAILGLQSQGNSHGRSKSSRVLVFALWLVPSGVVFASALMAVFQAGAASVKLEQVQPVDEKLFNATAFKIHAAALSYFREHGAFTLDGKALGLQNMHWQGASSRETTAGGYRIILQEIFSCTPGSCVFRAYAPTREVLCGTVDGRIVPDSDRTVRENVSTPGDEREAPKSCAPADIMIDPRWRENAKRR